ncbi:dentin sialophosphoprotein isoform X2 [Zeugodacus cucurbitae]|uniref:dentin sialophosphoprotein isoform X2 n=1 Tax=Zeugodacus cucurbitae TaxID=28588 RepID=UPI0023D8F41A|nr:dentin sialophosphoprotein isoform X2 [Zeugodacus cucurbitae]
MDSEDTSTGGRVTRSLRKRLTSVDSDASSRPSTPQLTKLAAIPETSSPSRALRGRRNSTTSSATPLKTPAKSKTATIIESNETENVPAKRTTRRSSVSAVSAADLLTTLKDEEEINTKGTPARRTRRLQSQTEVEKTPRSAAVKKKPAPKSRRSNHESESDSDIEVINLEDEQIDRKEKENSTTPTAKEQSTKTPIRMSPRLKAKSVSPKGNAVIIETIDLLEDTSTPHDTEEVADNPTESLRIESNENMNISDTNMKSFDTKEGEEVKLECLNSSLTEDTLVKETDTKEVSNKADSFDCNDVSADATAKSPNQSPLNSSKARVKSVVMLERLSPKVIDKMCGKRASISSPPNSKSVTFNDIDVDDEVKNTYPKTPASIKSKSYLAMDSTNDSKDQSFQSDKESNNSFKDASANVEIPKDNTANESKDSIEFHDATNDVEEVNNIQEAGEITSDFTPQKKKLSAKLQSSTPMLDSVSNSITAPAKLVTDSPVITKTSEEIDNNPEMVITSPVTQDETTTTTLQHEQKDIEKTNDDDKRLSLTVAATNESNNVEKTEDLFSKSWTHNVSGCATSDGKIDTLVVTTNDEEVTSEPLKVVDEQKTSPTVNKETVDEYVEQKDEEEEEEDEENIEKLEFVDDEAMEVDNYQSGDSMDAEERKEMLENEIIDEGESIGSEDTEESNEEDDEENASFVTSDSEESLLEYSDNEEHLENDSKKPNKMNSRNRILITSESEDSNVNISRTNSNKKKKTNKSNSRNRIISSSESEIEKQTATQAEPMNVSHKSSDDSENPLTLEVSRMIDDTTDDDDDNAKQTSKSQLAETANGNTESTNSNYPELDTKIKDENNMENSGQEQETKNETKLNTSQKRNTESETTKAIDISETVERTISSATEAQCNQVDTNDRKRRRSQSLSKSIYENIADNSNDNEENLNASKTCEKEDKNKSVNTLNRSMERSIRKSISSVHESDKTKETIGDTDIISADNKNASQNDFDSSGNTSEQMKEDEEPKFNGFDDMQSQNESNDEESVDGEDIEIPETQEVGQAIEENSSEESSAEETYEMLNVGKSVSKLKNAGLSLSFCQAKQKRVTVKDRIRHRSFTIGVSVTKSEDINQMEESSGSSDADEKEESADSNDSDRNLIDKQDEEELEKLAHSNAQFSNMNRKRKSMLSTFAQDNQEFACKRKSKRNSLQSISKEDFNPSQSLLENIEDYKRELQSQKVGKKTRLSKSFCDPVHDDMEALVDSGGSDVTNYTNNEKPRRHSLKNTELGMHSTASKSRLSKSFCGPIEEDQDSVDDSGDSDVKNNTISDKTKRRSLQNNERGTRSTASKSRLSKSFCGPIEEDQDSVDDSGDSDVKNNTISDKTKRKSLQNNELGTHSTTTKSRLSKSFCGAIQEAPNTSGDSSSSEKSADEVVNKKKINGSTRQELATTKNKKRDFGRILDRCDEILDAANRAKLESKQNYKKSRLLIPKSKKQSKPELQSDEESASDAPVIKKDMKQSKEKTTLALTQAFKASANILLKEATKVKKEKLLQNEEKYADKRLPMQLLESISPSHTETKKSKRERAREPNVQRLNCATGEIVEEVLSPPKKKRAVLKKIELPTGTVLEEPVTPKKKIRNSGFRESPITPRTLGFKVRHILTAGQDKVPQLPTTHGVERKRKQKLVDPKLVLPKPQWSQSGVFMEEVLPSRKMQGLNTMKSCAPGANEATVNALNFKSSSLFRKNVPREASHEILKRKERQYVRNRF